MKSDFCEEVQPKAVKRSLLSTLSKWTSTLFWHLYYLGRYAPARNLDHIRHMKSDTGVASSDEK